MNTNQPSNSPFGAKFFDSIRRSGWYRPRGSWIGGICAGMSAKTGIDLNLIRILTVLVTIFAWPLLIVYGLAWAFLPDETGKIQIELLFEGSPEPTLIGPVIFVGLGMVTTPSLGVIIPKLDFHDGGGIGLLAVLFTILLVLIVPIAAIGLIIYLVTRPKQPQTPPPPYFMNQANPADSQAFSQPESEMPRENQENSPQPEPQDETQAFPQTEAAATSEIPVNETFSSAVPVNDVPPGDQTGGPKYFSSPDLQVFQRPEHVIYKRPGPGRTISLLTLAFILLAAAGILWLRRGSDDPFITILIFSVFLLVLSAIGIVLSLAGRRTGWIGAVATFTALIFVLPVVFFFGMVPEDSAADIARSFKNGAINMSIGDRHVSLCGDSYLAIGSSRLDTRNWDGKPCVTTISNTIGDVKIDVSQGQNIIIRARVETGQVEFESIGNWWVQPANSDEVSINTFRENSPTTTEDIGFNTNGQVVKRFSTEWKSPLARDGQRVIFRSSKQATEDNSLVIKVNKGVGQIKVIEHPDKDLLSATRSSNSKLCINGYWEHKTGNFVPEYLKGTDPKIIDWECSSITPPDGKQSNPDQKNNPAPNPNQNPNNSDDGGDN